jgi:NADH:ubiquinone oxidoreductase subunit C
MIELSEVADLLRHRGMRFQACMADDDDEVVLTVSAADYLDLVEQLRSDPDIGADILLARTWLPHDDSHHRVVTLLWSQALHQRFVLECVVSRDHEVPTVATLFGGAVVDGGGPWDGPTP